MTISDNTIKRLERSRAVVDRIVDSKVPTYGINTGKRNMTLYIVCVNLSRLNFLLLDFNAGFGLLSHTYISMEELRHLQVRTQYLLPFPKKIVMFTL